MTEESKQMLTLFAPGMPETRKSIGYPYSLAVKQLSLFPDDRIPEIETSIFSHIVEQEVSLYERRGYIAGPVTIRICNKQTFDLSGISVPFPLPCCVEHDEMDFISSEASGVLLVEDNCFFDALFSMKSWQSNGLLLATGSGMPRAPMRRFLHLLQKQFQIPVYVLSDNDTWGYFMFSMLSRGALAPDVRASFMSIKNLRYVGLRAGRDYCCGDKEGMSRPWQSNWDVRLKHLRRYDCFQSEEWQSEFRAFENQKHAKTLGKLLEGFGAEHILKTVNRSIQDKDWLISAK